MWGENSLGEAPFLSTSPMGKDAWPLYFRLVWGEAGQAEPTPQEIEPGKHHFENVICSKNILIY